MTEHERLLADVSREHSQLLNGTHWVRIRLHARTATAICRECGGQVNLVQQQRQQQRVGWHAPSAGRRPGADPREQLLIGAAGAENRL